MEQVPALTWIGIVRIKDHLPLVSLRIANVGVDVIVIELVPFQVFDRLTGAQPFGEMFKPG